MNEILVVYILNPSNHLHVCVCARVCVRVCVHIKYMYIVTVNVFVSVYKFVYIHDYTCHTCRDSVNVDNIIHQAGLVGRLASTRPS